ncbi:MAG: serine hydrolase domain-containing protein, partial [Bacteroidota bacterium]
MRLLISFLLLVATCSACSLPAQPVEERLDDLGPAIQQLLNDYHAAGLALAVVDKDKVRFARGYGFRDVDQQLPVDEHTVFGIGSITKAFTASILGQLEVQGELDFYDSPQTYLPELSFSTDEMNESIRIHHLLTHSTGLSGFMTESTAILFLTENRQALLQRLQHFPPMAAAGERYDYSNMMYTLVGYIGASITGKSWQENVRTRLFAPLSMQDSYTSARAAQQAANFSLGYAVQDSLYPATVLPEKVPSRAPAGDIYSSVSDMSKWMRMW